MRELIIGENEGGQRLDRFIKKYLDEAPLGFIYRMIRKKNITVNDKKVKPESMIEAGDVVKLFLAEETIEKFISQEENRASEGKLDVVAEDDHLIFLNKPANLLTHGIKSREGFEDNMVDRMIHYLIDRGDYNPRVERTFRPALANRLDRNTTGILLGAKTYEALKLVNEAMREDRVTRIYLALVKGRARAMEDKAYMVRNERKNKTKIVEKPMEDAKLMKTKMEPIASDGHISLVAVELFTGRTHQIRSQLRAWGYPLLGDPKYGDPRFNQLVSREYGIKRQMLHAESISLDGLEGDLAVWNKQTITCPPPRDMQEMMKLLLKDQGGQR